MDWFDTVPVDDISQHVDDTSNDERERVTGGREVDHVPGEEAGEEGEGDVGGDDRPAIARVKIVCRVEVVFFMEHCIHGIQHLHGG